MKVFVCFLFIFGIERSQGSGDWLGSSVNGDFSPSDGDYHIKRPCHYNDVDCIRSYLAYNYMCLFTHEPARDPYIIKKLDVIVPLYNISSTLNNVVLRGLESGKITEFFVNTKTNTLVLEVVFDKLVVDSELTVTSFHQKGKETLKAEDFSIATYKDLSLTLNVEHFHDAHRVTSNVYAHLSDSDIDVKIGPGLSDSSASGIADMAAWTKQTDLVVREGLVTQSQDFMSAFLITRMLCDFRF